MDMLHERCAGVDISKKDAKACVRTPSTKRRGFFHDCLSEAWRWCRFVLAAVGP